MTISGVCLITVLVFCHTVETEWQHGLLLLWIAVFCLSIFTLPYQITK